MHKSGQLVRADAARPQGAAHRLADSAFGPVLVGGLSALALTAVVIGWSSTMSVASAAIALGRVAVEGNRKAIQHREGGAIGAVLVREGQFVERGQKLLQLDTSDLQAEVAVLTGNRVAFLCRAARLRAEAVDAEGFSLPEVLVGQKSDPQIEATFQQEQALFAARRATYLGQVSLLRQQIEGSNRQIVGLQGRLKATETQLASVEDELTSLRPLVEKGLIARPRTTGLERSAAGLQGDIEIIQASISAEKDKIKSAEIQIAQLIRDRQEGIARDSVETDARLAEIEPRLRSAQERLGRSTLVAPESGYVYGLSVFGPGATVVPGQTVLEIVPADDPLVVSVDISPIDINRVSPGQSVDIHLLPYRQRYQRALRGSLEKISPDRFEDKASNKAYYRGIVKIRPGDLTAAHVELVPGMPAEVTIETGKRTILAYFLDPVFRIYDFALKEQ